MNSSHVVIEINQSSNHGDAFQFDLLQAKEDAHNADEDSFEPPPLIADDSSEQKSLNGSYTPSSSHGQLFMNSSTAEFKASTLEPQPNLSAPPFHATVQPTGTDMLHATSTAEEYNPPLVFHAGNRGKIPNPP